MTGEAASLFIVVIFKSSLKLVGGPALHLQKVGEEPAKKNSPAMLAGAVLVLNENLLL